MGPRHRKARPATVQYAASLSTLLYVSGNECVAWHDVSACWQAERRLAMANLELFILAWSLFDEIVQGYGARGSATVLAEFGRYL